jgi:hypothetical protein
MGQRIEVATDDPEAKLERALMQEFLRRSHHSFSDLAFLTPGERNQLLDRAARYADERLAEIGARAHYIEELHKHE